MLGLTLPCFRHYYSLKVSTDWFRENAIAHENENENEDAGRTRHMSQHNQRLFGN